MGFGGKRPIQWGSQGWARHVHWSATKITRLVDKRCVLYPTRIQGTCAPNVRDGKVAVAYYSAYSYQALHLESGLVRLARHQKSTNKSQKMLGMAAALKVAVVIAAALQPPRVVKLPYTPCGGSCTSDGTGSSTP